MPYAVSGSMSGRFEILAAGTAQVAKKQATKLHELGVFPVHIKKDGVLIQTPEELDRFIRENC